MRDCRHPFTNRYGSRVLLAAISGIREIYVQVYHEQLGVLLWAVFSDGAAAEEVYGEAADGGRGG